jgi:polyhydroxybutyrate depolymerase
MRNATVIALLTIGLGACGSKTTVTGRGAGGESGANTRGGAQGSAGAASSGGVPNMGGRSGSGDATGTAGATGSGGGTISGGVTRSGGTTTTGGTTRSGGETGSKGGTARGGATNAGGTTGSAGANATGGETGRGTSSAGGSTGQLDAGSSRDTTPSDASRDALEDVYAAADATPQTCSASQPTPGNLKASLQHGGQSRSYILHVPSGLTGAKPLAVVFDLHGAGGSGSQQQGLSGWDAVANREGFLTVYPDGTGGYWNVDDTCCGTAGTNKIDDVGFVRAIIEKLRAGYCIDSQRIYVSGFSNGGGLTHRLGCEAADVIAAIAPMSTDLRTQPCTPARPISMMEFRGTADSLEPYEGGLVGPAGGQYLAVGAKASLKLWADINLCTGTPTTIDKYCESYTACGGGVETDLCSLPKVDHSPYGNSLSFSVVDTAWKMFQRHP